MLFQLMSINVDVLGLEVEILVLLIVLPLIHSIKDPLILPLDDNYL
jgi:hypothetical protein